MTSLCISFFLFNQYQNKKDRTKSPVSKMKHTILGLLGYHSSNPETMATFVREVCQCQRTGARVIPRETFLLVKDISTWPQSYSDRVHAQYPSARISFFDASSSSMGGLGVHIEYGNQYPHLWNFAVLLLCFCSMIVLLIINLQFTLPNHYIVPNKHMPTATASPSSHEEL